MKSLLFKNTSAYLIAFLVVVAAVRLIVPLAGLGDINWWQALGLVAVCSLVIMPIFGYPYIRAKKIDQQNRMRSRPGEYGALALMSSLLPAITVCAILFIGIILVQNLFGVDTEIPAWVFAAVSIPTLIIGAIWAFTKVRGDFSARLAQERIIVILMIVCAVISILTTVGIVFSILFQSIEFFSHVSIVHFLTGTEWSPDHSETEHVGLITEGFGALPLFVGTFLITAIAMLVAVPVGLLSAVYMSEYASHRVRGIAKPMLEILAGIPTVVYGFFAAITISPIVVSAATSMGLEAAPTNALAAGLVMGIMIIPFMSSLSDDVINSVPDALRQGGLALGLTKAETINNIIVPAAMPGIISAFLLAMSRALGETMIVVMAVGLSANLTVNPLESVTTVTVRIVDALTGDQEFGTPETLSAFALGMVLFLVTLALNLISTIMVRRFKEKYS